MTRPPDPVPCEWASPEAIEDQRKLIAGLDACKRVRAGCRADGHGSQGVEGGSEGFCQNYPGQVRPAFLAELQADVDAYNREGNWSKRVRESTAAWLNEVAHWQCFATLTFAPRRSWQYRGDVNKGASYAKHVLAWKDEREGRTERWRPQDDQAFCERVVSRFYCELNEEFFGRRYRRKEQRVKLFVPWEKQKRGALHCHPLIAGLPAEGERVSRLVEPIELGGSNPTTNPVPVHLLHEERDRDDWSYDRVRKCWERAQRALALAPGFSWLRPFDPERCPGYVSKYVCKDLTGDAWALYGFPGQGTP